MTTLENQFLKINIKRQGAELTSVFNKRESIEHLWQGNPDIWGWHAPNLFPIVGGVVNNQLMVDNQAYSMERHGFARHSEFELIESNSSNAKFSLRYNESTLKVYPYKFEFQIIYDLLDGVLRVTYKIINEDDIPVYFSVGAHPAFNVPFLENENYEDYYLEFESPDKLERHYLSKEGYFTGQTDIIASSSNTIALTPVLFDKEAIVFKDLNSRRICLKSKNHSSYVEMYYPHFNELGIWSKKGAPFICIEPWLGYADNVNEPRDIKDKKSIQVVEQGHVFEAAFTIAIH